MIAHYKEKEEIYTIMALLFYLVEVSAPYFGFETLKKKKTYIRPEYVETICNTEFS